MPQYLEIVILLNAYATTVDPTNIILQLSFEKYYTVVLCLIGLLTMTVINNYKNCRLMGSFNKRAKPAGRPLTDLAKIKKK
jgi:hypothetical protein